MNLSPNRIVLLLLSVGAGISAQYEQCGTNEMKIGDGSCDQEGNNAECGYDGGDCCHCSCVEDTYFDICGEDGYDCRVPGYLMGEIFGCDEEPLVDAPCPTSTSTEWVVNDTTSAIALADAMLCSGGTFNVEWRGHVSINRTIEVAHGTVLRVAGTESGAEMEAAFDIRLFTVINASLDISNIDITGGSATNGGAIAAAGSHVSLDKTSFAGNSALYGGGAVYATLGSNVSCGKGTIFDGNYAGVGGGALYIGIDSSLIFRGYTSFTNNVADRRGGALYVYRSDVSSTADVSFINNTADEDGGALYVYESHSSWGADVSFINNTADNKGGGALYVYASNMSWEADASSINIFTLPFGGAMYALESSTSWTAGASFVNNTAALFGGAMYVYRSNVYCAADTLFRNNTVVQQNGGALYISNSKVFWAAKVSFITNIAAENGGALHVRNSAVSWTADSSFINNACGGFGGALYVYGSKVSWVAEASFISNTAKDDGGAMHVLLFSNVSWAAKASFTENKAGVDGGAVSITSGSGVSWRGRVSFLNNTAGDHGGALFITSVERQDVIDGTISGGEASLEMDTRFFANSAGDDGGAAYVYASYDATSGSSLNIGGNTIFLENRCEGVGGAVSIAVSGSVTFGTENITFSKNSASAAGGAVYVNGLGIGPKFAGLTFVSNWAQIGGAVYVVGSGTLTIENDAGEPMQNPTTFDRCKFMGNEAERTGGAVNTGAGLDLITNTYFAGNTAGTGGALRLAGTTTLHNCTFMENTSDEGEGPAVSNVGFVSNITSCSFIDNAFVCEQGRFLDLNATNDSDDVLDIVCNGCAVEDHKSTTSLAIPACMEELKHTKSSGGNATVEALVLLTGYWRATNTSRKILACFNAEACLGGVTGASTYCREGYEGPYCSICRKGYSPSLGHTCNKCFANVTAVVVSIIIATSAILAVATLLYLECKRSAGAGRGLLSSWRRRLLSLKIVIIVWQILTQFTSVANVTYPDFYQVFLDGIDIFNFDLSWILSVECVVDLNFYHRLIMSTLGPPVALAIVGAMYVFAMHGNSTSRDVAMVVTHEELDRRYLSLILLLTFLVYSSVSSTLFRMFACDELDDGKSYLRADYRIDCKSPTHVALQIYAGLMIVIYAMGIPVLYGILLFRDKQVLMDESVRKENAKAKSISNLWELYKPNCFYYELIECVRRILVAGVIVFILPNTTAQVGVALMIASFFMILSEIMRPYASFWDTWVNRIGHGIVFSSIYLALLLKIDVSDEGKGSQRLFETTLIAAHGCMLLVAIFESMMLTYQWYKRRG